MKILHLNTYEKAGGAAIAANRIHQALNEHTEYTSIMGVLNKQSDAENVYPLQMYSSRIARIFDHKVYKRIEQKLKPSSQTYFSHYLLPNNLVPAIAELKPDIIHLHWIAHFISPWVLEKLAKLNIPIMWTLHDTWAFTGGCHYYGQCDKWQSECKNCPHVQSIFNVDFINLQWKAKQKAYQALKPHIITLSHFFLHDIQLSPLLHNRDASHLPNTLDTNIFRPIDKNIARDILNLEQDKKYILFGSDNASKDPRKGYDLLAKALSSLSKEEKTSSFHCLVFGATHGEVSEIPTAFLGRINDAITLALMYSAADVFVCPSREDNLPNTVLESLACGTAVVGFDIGGIPDMVQHKENGYVAIPYDIQDFANGIIYVLEDESRHEAMSKYARQVVEQRYANDLIAKQYISLYEKISSKKLGY